jgi:predicted transcriptional regulator
MISISYIVLTNLDMSVFCVYIASMPNIKISSKVDETAWEELKQLASESHQNISGVLTDAIRDYVRKRRVRPAVMQHLEDSIRDNEELGRLLAK